MAILFLSTTFVSLVILFFVLLHKYISSNFDYWKRRGVIYFVPKPIVGNLYEVLTFKKTFGHHIAEYYKATSERFFGIYFFNKPQLVIRDPEILKRLLIKDFEFFSDRNILSSDYEPVFSHALFLSKNPDWRILRKKLSPIFTSGKLKNMFPLIDHVGEKMVKYIHQNLTKEFIETKELSRMYTTDVISKCAFGIDVDSFENTENEFRKAGNTMFDFNWSNSIQQICVFIIPEVANFFRMTLFDNKSTNFLHRVFCQSVLTREKSHSEGHDLIDLIVQLKKSSEFQNQIESADDKLVGQAAQFFAAGFETTSTTISFTLYELVMNPGIQKKLQIEIKDHIENAGGGLTYEVIQEMTYLDMVVSETLRKYPTLPFLDRKCNADYKLPNSNLTIEKGISILVPLFGLHYDPQYFPNPHQFIPERFDKHETIPSVYMPFGNGPRNCIGERFALLVTKTALVHILSKFEVQRAPQTPVIMKFATKSLVLASTVGVPLILKKLSL